MPKMHSASGSLRRHFYVIFIAFIVEFMGICWHGAERHFFMGMQCTVTS